MVWDLWCFEDLEEEDRLINQSVNDGGGCKTAPTTPGLLNTDMQGEKFFVQKSSLVKKAAEVPFML